jgi:hypothetical protein
MGEEIFEPDDAISVMFKNKKNIDVTDEELALHIIHRFNICRDTMETMPAFKKCIDPLFSKVKQK